MTVWKKLGLIFDLEQFTSLPNWFTSYAQAPNAVVIDSKLRIYFCGRPNVDEDGQFISRAGYVEFESLNPPKISHVSENPVIELGSLGEFDESGTYPFSVEKLNDEGGFVAVYGGWTRKQSVPFDVSLGIAKSHDGKIFKKIGSGPILSSSLHEPFVVTSPKVRKYGDLWLLAYTAGTEWFLDKGRPEIVYKLRMATSQDGTNWIRLNRNIVSDKIGEMEAQACPDIFFRDGTYHMFFCYRYSTDFRENPQRTYRIGYASSSDGMNWVRNDNKAGIDVGDQGWDSAMIAYPNIVEFQGKTYMLYLGNHVGKYGFGAAELIGDIA